ncbi:hypothetical protein KIPB_001622, partial [Kipferlia bialata]
LSLVSSVLTWTECADGTCPWVYVPLDPLAYGVVLSVCMCIGAYGGRTMHARLLERQGPGEDTHAHTVAESLRHSGEESECGSEDSYSSDHSYCTSTTIEYTSEDSYPEEDESEDPDGESDLMGHDTHHTCTCGQGADQPEGHTDRVHCMLRISLFSLSLLLCVCHIVYATACTYDMAWRAIVTRPILEDIRASHTSVHGLFHAALKHSVRVVLSGAALRYLVSSIFMCRRAGAAHVGSRATVGYPQEESIQWEEREREEEEDGSLGGIRVSATGVHPSIHTSMHSEPPSAEGSDGREDGDAAMPLLREVPVDVVSERSRALFPGDPQDVRASITSSIPPEHKEVDTVMLPLSGVCPVDMPCTPMPSVTCVMVVPTVDMQDMTRVEIICAKALQPNIGELETLDNQGEVVLAELPRLFPNCESLVIENAMTLPGSGYLIPFIGQDLFHKTYMALASLLVSQSLPLRSLSLAIRPRQLHCLPLEVGFLGLDTLRLRVPLPSNREDASYRLPNQSQTDTGDSMSVTEGCTPSLRHLSLILHVEEGGDTDDVAMDRIAESLRYRAWESVEIGVELAEPGDDEDAPCLPVLPLVQTLSLSTPSLKHLSLNLIGADCQRGLSHAVAQALECHSQSLEWVSVVLPSSDTDLSYGVEEMEHLQAIQELCLSKPMLHIDVDNDSAGQRVWPPTVSTQERIVLLGTTDAIETPLLEGRVDATAGVLTNMGHTDWACVSLRIPRTLERRAQYDPLLRRVLSAAQSVGDMTLGVQCSQRAEDGVSPCDTLLSCLGDLFCHKLRLSAPHPVPETMLRHLIPPPTLTSLCLEVALFGPDLSHLRHFVCGCPSLTTLELHGRLETPDISPLCLALQGCPTLTRVCISLIHTYPDSDGDAGSDRVVGLVESLPPGVIDLSVTVPDTSTPLTRLVESTMTQTELRLLRVAVPDAGLYLESLRDYLSMGTPCPSPPLPTLQLEIVSQGRTVVDIDRLTRALGSLKDLGMPKPVVFVSDPASPLCSPSLTTLCTGVCVSDWAHTDWMGGWGLGPTGVVITPTDYKLLLTGTVETEESEFEDYDTTMEGDLSYTYTLDTEEDTEDTSETAETETESESEYESDYESESESDSYSSEGS